MRTLTARKETKKEMTGLKRALASMILAGSLATGAGAATASCTPCGIPGSCDTKDYPVELREGERIETVSGQYPLRLEVLEGGISQQVQPDVLGRCEVKSDRAQARLSIYPPGTTDLDATAPIHTRDLFIYPGSCIGIWDYCIRIEGSEMPVDVERSVSVSDAGVATVTCTPSNERVKFTISLSRGEVFTPDGGYFQDSGTGGSGGSAGSSDGGSGGS